jgi:hypothetical protein
VSCFVFCCPSSRIGWLPFTLYSVDCLRDRLPLTGVEQDSVHESSRSQPMFDDLIQRCRTKAIHSTILFPRQSSKEGGLDGIAGLEEAKRVVTEALILPVRYPQLFLGFWSLRKPIYLNSRSSVDRSAALWSSWYRFGFVRLFA